MRFRLRGSAGWLAISLIVLFVTAEACKSEKPRRERRKEASSTQEATVESTATPTEAAEAVTDTPKERTAKAKPALEVPPDVVGYGAVANFDSMIAMATEFASRLEAMPGPALKGMIELGFQTELGLQNLAWLRRDSPIRIVGWNPKVSGDRNDVLVLPIASQDAFVKALPADKKKGSGGNIHMYTSGPDTVYVNFTEGHAVLTYDARVFALAKPFVEGKLADFAPTDAIDIYLCGKNLTRIYGEELNRFQAEFIKEAGSSNLDFQGMASVSEDQVKWLFELIGSVDTVVLSVRTEGMHAILSAELQGASGGVVSSLIAGMKGRVPSLTDRIPPNSYMAFANNGDPTGPTANDGLQTLAKLLSAEWKLSEDDQKELDARLDVLIHKQTGDSLFAAYPSGSFPFSLVAMSSVEDG